MIASGLLRIKPLSGKGKVLIASRHNKRAIQRELGAAAHIDATRIPLNYSLGGSATSTEVADAAKAKMKAANVLKPRKNAVLGIEILFSLPKDFMPDTRPYFAECLTWAERHFGGAENVLSADVHLDEAAPHMHVLILPLANGKLCGSVMCGNRQRFQFLQNDLFNAVSSRYGLQRPQARLRGPAREKAAQAVLQALRTKNDPLLKSEVWLAARDLIERDPQPFAQALGIALEQPVPKKMRTSTQIFISRGKGPRRREREDETSHRKLLTNTGPNLTFALKPIGNARPHFPIGEQPPETDHSLCSVGIAPESSSETDTALREMPLPIDDGRIVDRSDIDFNGWPDDAEMSPGSLVSSVGI